jgi:thioredoxin
MNKQELLQYSLQDSRTVIVEFWAPWCIPCRLMAPALEKTAHQFLETVDLIRINADEFQKTVQELGILGIPSIIVISKGKVAARHTGALDAFQLENLFKSASNQADILIPPTRGQRLLRIGSGLTIALMGYLWGPPVPFYLLGSGIVFSGLYDRSPVFKMLYPKIKTLLFKNTFQT